MPAIEIIELVQRSSHSVGVACVEDGFDKLEQPDARGKRFGIRRTG